MLIKNLDTEKRNENTMNIDIAKTEEIVRLINDEDKLVAIAVEKEITNIAKAIDLIVEAIKNGGRLVYVGAGTSGRLGILDASECPPTYGVPKDLVIALIAGGKNAILNAVEGAEDDTSLCEKDLTEINFTHKDILVAIAASGRTPYAIGGLNFAKKVGAKTICIACTKESEMQKIADVAITPIVGAEAVTGSTRMKAGTAQKLVLNTLSTGTMIKLGKVYQNLMVDVMPSNKKLVERCVQIVIETTNVSYDAAETALMQCGFNPKTAIVMLLLDVDEKEAREILSKNDESIRKSIAHK